MSLLNCGLNYFSGLLQGHKHLMIDLDSYFSWVQARVWGGSLDLKN